jgi:CheY-like chemotaxis protein
MPIILLVDDDPLQARWRKSVLEELFPDVRRVLGAVDALCLVEEPQFAKNLVLVVCGHLMPGIGGPAFVAELQDRMPSVPVLVLGNGTDAPSDYEGEQVRFLGNPANGREMLTVARQMIGDGHRF